MEYTLQIYFWYQPGESIQGTGKHIFSKEPG